MNNRIGPRNLELGELVLLGQDLEDFLLDQEISLHMAKFNGERGQLLLGRKDLFVGGKAFLELIQELGKVVALGLEAEEGRVLDLGYVSVGLYLHLLHDELASYLSLGGYLFLRDGIHAYNPVLLLEFLDIVLENRHLSLHVGQLGLELIPFGDIAILADRMRSACRGGRPRS